MQKPVNTKRILIVFIIVIGFALSFSLTAECILDIPLYEGPGKVADKSPAKRKIWIVGGKWIESGSASFLELDGKNNSILIKEDDLKLQNLTLSFWVKPYPSNDYLQCLVKGAWGCGNYHGFAIIMQKHGSANQVFLNINFGDMSPKSFSFGVIPTNKFTHLSFKYDRKKISLYKNGIKVASFDENRNINYSETGSQLRLAKGYGKHFKGIIAGLKIFSKGTDDAFIASLSKENKEIFKNTPENKQGQTTHVLLGSDNVSGTNKQNSGPRKTLLINYRFNSGKGLKIKDYSPFHNDANIMGAKWANPAKWQKDGGLIISSDGALIPGSSVINPDKFSLHLKLKPLQAIYSDIFYLYVSPFYLKDRTLTWKNKDKLFYPLYYIFQVQLLGKNKIRVMMSLKDKSDKLIRKSFVSETGLTLDKFSNVIITFGGKQLTLTVNGNKQSFPISGQLYYELPQLYSGHVNAALGGRSIIEYKDLKFYSLDNLNALKHKYAIKITTPYDLNFFTQKEPKTLDIGISSFYDTLQNGEVSITSSDYENKVIFQSQFKVKLKPLCENNFRITVPQETRGCFWVDCTLTEQGKIVAKRTTQYSVGAIRDRSNIPDSSPFGVCSTSGTNERHEDFGEKWSRVSAWWVNIERQDNQFDFSKLDKIINANYQQGINTYMVFIAWAPKWLTGSKKAAFINPENEDHFKYYERMLRKIMSRYKGKIGGYDIIGEANAAPFFRASPDFYLRIAEIFHKVKQEINPEAFVGGPSAWKGGWDQPTERFLQVGAGQYWDRYDTHYIGGAGGYYFVPEESVLETIKGSREMMAKYDLELPIIDSETGYPVASRRAADSRPMTYEQLQAAITRKDPFSSLQLWTPHPWKYYKTSHDELTCAQFTVRRMILCLSKGVNLHLRQWTLSYNSEINPRFGRNLNTGVLLPGIAWTTMVQKLSWAKFVRKIHLANPKTYAYLFYDTKKKKYLAVLWSSDKKQMVYINPDSTNPELFDIWGNPQVCNFVKKNLMLKLSESPIYLENVGKNIREVENLLTVSLPKQILPQEPCKMTIGMNNSQNKPITWTIDIKTGKNVKCEKNHFSIDLKPGEKKTISTIFTPNDKAKGKINIEIKLNSTEYGEIIRNVSTIIKKKPTLVSKTASEINIDGDSSDWPENAQKIFLGKMDQVKYGLNSLDIHWRNPERDWVGIEDLSGDIKLCWDPGNIYVLADIKDPERNILRSGSRILACDGFELFLDGRNPDDLGKNPYEILKGVRHIFVSPGAEGSSKVAIRIKGPEGEKLAGMIKATSRKTDKGYVVEMKIPVTKEFFPQLQLEKDRIIGFNMYLNDADKLPKRKSTIVWQGNVESNIKPSDFGQIILEE